MKKILYIFFTGLLLAACTDLTELNTDPVNSTDMTPHLLMPGIQLGQSQGYYQVRSYIDYPGGIVNLWTGKEEVAAFGGVGVKNAIVMEQPWNYTYKTLALPAVLMEERTKDDPQEINLHSAATILKVEVFLRLTDWFGDIPYSEACRYYQDNSLIKPKYDKQEDIYKSFLKELRTAVGAFDPSKPAPQYDLYFNGDIARWKKFGASLWLRIAMRLVKVDPELAKAEAKAAYEAGIMESNADICMVKHEDDRTQNGTGNAYANFLYDHPEGSEFRMTEEIVQALNNDPRLYFIGGFYTLNDRLDVTTEVAAALKAYGGTLGIPAHNLYQYAGLMDTYLPINGKDVMIHKVIQSLQPSVLITNPASPWIHLSYAETQFFLAEAAVRGWGIGKESAEQYYARGLEAAIRQWSLFGAKLPDDEHMQQFLAYSTSLMGSTPTSKLEEINKQLWILYVLDPMEAWSNVRRTGMPSAYVKYFAGGSIPDYRAMNESDFKRPIRMCYPLNEQTYNGDHLKEAIDRMGGTDDWTAPVWWDNGEYLK